MTSRRIIRWIVGLSAFCFILLVVIALVLPRVIDSQTVKEKIRAVLLEKTNGTVTIERIDFSWFPRPTAVIRGASLAADKSSGTIPAIKVYPSILGIVTGRSVVSGVVLESPTIALRLQEPAEGAVNVDELENTIRSLLTKVASEVPGIAVGINNGSGEIRIGNRPPFAFTEFNARLTASSSNVNLQMSSGANVFDQLRVEAQIAGETLATQGRIRVDRLHLREAIASLLSRPHGYIEQGTLNLDLRFTSVGLKKIKAEVDGSVPALGLVRENSGKTVIEVSALKGFVTRDDGIFRTVITRLDLASPKLTVSGDMTIDTASSLVRLKIDGGNFDAAVIRDSALKIAGDVEPVRNLFQYLRGGTISELSFETTGQSLTDLKDVKNIVASAKMHRGSISVAESDIDLQDVTGLFAVSGGMLEGKDCSARLGKAEGKDGTLRLGLEGNNVPFHLDIVVQSGAAELHSLLLRLIKDDRFHQELSRIREVKGALSGRLMLGERVDSLSSKVSVSKIAVNASYDRIPYPIAIKAGGFKYSAGKISSEGMAGTIGHSSFSEVTGSLSNDEMRQIEISSGSLSLDLEQIRNLLNNFEPLREELKDVRLARGKLGLDSLFLKGPLTDPSRWDFRAEGSVDGIAVEHAKLPGLTSVPQGRFSATPTKLMFSGTTIETLDASLSVGGSLEVFDKGLSLDATGSGVVGAQMTGWLSRQVEIPEQLALRSPLRLTNGRVFWRTGGVVSLLGTLIVNDGPRVSLDMVREPQRIEFKELVVADGERRAHMTLNLERDKFALSFKGGVSQQTLRRIFQSPPLQGSLLEGDIQISALKAPSLQFSARGKLEARDLLIPLKDAPLVVERLVMEGAEDSVKIRSADLRSRASRLSISGNLALEKETLGLDMDVTADRLVWEEISRAVYPRGDGGGGTDTSEIPFPVVEGTVRLKTDVFMFGGLNSSPLQVTASLSSKGIAGEIERAVICGLGVAGRFDVADKHIQLDARVSARDSQLEPTSLCLTANKHALKGIYSLSAHLTGRGDGESLARSIKGEFEFTARDGEFVRSPAVEAAFDYLNNTGDFSVPFPDLERESFPFRMIIGKGTIEGTSILSHEFIIEASPFTLTAQGKLDLEHKQIDAKGLVSVLMPANRVIKRLPVVGSVIGGSLVGIPVQVTGSLERPEVSYLAPRAVGTELLSVPARILGIPLEAIRLFTPAQEEEGK